MMFDGIQCQHTDVRKYSRFSRPTFFIVISRMLLHLRTQGLAFTVKKAAEVTERILGFKGPRKKVRKPLTQESVLGLQPGELVQVKSEAEIMATLDEHGRCRGLAFLPEMSQHIGARLRVLKRVEQIFLEESRQGRKTRNTVLLEGVNCQGIGIGCDRSCFLFWREAWLERVETLPTDEITQIPGVDQA